MSKNTDHLVDAYGWFGVVGLSRDVFLTKLTYPQARVIRRPMYIRGRKWIAIGKGFTCGRGLRMDALPQITPSGVLLTIGKDVQINDYVHLAAALSVVIRDRVLIASKVFISDHDHGNYTGTAEQDSPLVPPAKRKLFCAPVVIEDDVWIGEFAAILRGVTIGRGSIIGAHSTVTKNIPPYSIAVGSPAKVIKQYDFEKHVWERV